jgi:DNA (cytosine-5)-methyltransferase 1
MTPRLLDLFCGAGGAAKGYQRAGFYVVGVDIKPQPHYCGDEFYQADALTYPLEGFDAYHASPPCQGYAVTRSIPNRDFTAYPLLIDQARARFIATGKPYSIENVPTAPLLNPVVLCGSMFGLRTRRHRAFECNPPIYFVPFTCNHSGRVKKPGNGKSLNIYVKDTDSGNVTVAGHLFSLRAGSRALGIDWMNRDELAEAIPPAYTEFIGKYLIQTLNGES